ncbi:amidohydrolase family protein [Longispora albida]|uniref:amidohydrolase family protein n=1 Tax=Longispora albida TaxID=203523 RepID=UPI000367D9FD
MHVHFLPPGMQEKVWRYFDGTGIWPIEYRLPAAERLEILAGLGVRHFTSLVYPHKPGMAGWLTDWALDFAATAPGCVPSATFYPEPSALGYVTRALERGARIFKAHVQVGGYDPLDPLLDPVWGLLAEAGVPTVIHCGSGPLPGTHTGPGPVGAVLARHPGLRLVIAHLGLPEYHEHLDLAVRYSGVHLDTTMAGTDFTNRLAPIPADVLPRLADLGDRIVLGSDFPSIPYRYEHQLEALVRLGFGDDWLRAVLWDNGTRLMGVPA